ncbi:MAG TPA: response regulator, partial [Longimicrobiales bacterium]
MADARILVVDDDRLIRSAIAERLERRGYDVVAAGSLAEARAAIAATSPDIAMLDVRLPDGVGTDLLRELVAETDAACVMMTAHGT